MERPDYKDFLLDTFCNMKWTTEKPTEPGWYWRRNPEHNEQATVVLIVLIGDDLYLFDDFYSDHVPIGDCLGEWSSTPIPEPEER